MTKTNKPFDCVDMKRRLQESIYEETKDMTAEQEIARYRAAAEAFWQGDQGAKLRDDEE